MVQLTDKHICVQLTEYYYELHVRNGELIWVDEKGFGHFATLPPGSYQFLFTTKEATEEDYRTELPSIIDKDFVYFHEYMFAFIDLLKSKGCDVNKNYAIIKKK